MMMNEEEKASTSNAYSSPNSIPIDSLAAHCIYTIYVCVCALWWNKTDYKHWTERKAKKRTFSSFRSHLSAIRRQYPTQNNPNDDDSREWQEKIPQKKLYKLCIVVHGGVSTKPIEKFIETSRPSACGICTIHLRRLLVRWIFYRLNLSSSRDAENVTMKNVTIYCCRIAIWVQFFFAIVWKCSKADSIEL